MTFCILTFYIYIYIYSMPLISSHSMVDAAGTLSHTKPASTRSLYSRFLPTSNITYFITILKNTDLQLLSRPCMFQKYNSTHDAALVSSSNPSTFTSNNVFQFLQRMWIVHLLYHSVFPTNNIWLFNSYSIQTMTHPGKIWVLDHETQQLLILEIPLSCFPG